MDDREEQVLADLQKWRQQQIDAGRLAPGILKDAHLKHISRRHTAESIKQILPGPVRWAMLDLAYVVTRAKFEGSQPPTTEQQETPASFETIEAPLLDNVLDLGHDDFCGYLSNRPDGPVADLEIAPHRAGGHLLRWPADEPTDGAVVVFRVVSGNGRRPHKPEAGVPMAVTTSTELHVRQEPAAALQVVQVWRHRGEDLDEAQQNQPELIAEGQIVSPVLGFELSHDHGHVGGRWRALPGTVRVRVYRVPSSAGPAAGQEQYRILNSEDNLDGFTDSEARAGNDYAYRVVSEVRLDHAIVLSERVEQEISVPSALRAVTDLECTRGGRGDMVWLDLSWTAPGSRDVRIYRTHARPPLRLTNAVIPEDGLISADIPPEQRLSPEHRITNPIRGDERSTMSQVAWPRGPEWAIVYLTPVTVEAGMALVGPTITAIRPARGVRQARVIERCDEQLITFAWPEGADEVRVYLADGETPAEQAVRGYAAATIDKSRYDRDGGLHLGPLPPRGRAVHLVPVTFSGRRATEGAVTTVWYPGLLRVHYEVAAQHDRRGGSWLYVRLAPELNNDSAPPFVLVHNPDRLPLSIDDGRMIEYYHYGSAETPGSRIHPRALAVNDPSVWRTPIEEMAGFIRLFADLPRPELACTLAILDPPLSTLSLSGAETRTANPVTNGPKGPVGARFSRRRRR
ncbi:hypothetical protein [Rhodococcus koreensis]